MAVAALFLELPLAAATGLAPGSYLRGEDHRVAEVAYRLALSAAQLCAPPSPLTGLLLHHLPEYAPAARTAYIRDYALDRGPGVLSVVEGSPAAQAGLRAGDVLLAVNGQAFPSPVLMARERDRRRWRPMAERSEALLEDQLQQGPAALAVLRNGETLHLTLAAVPACPMRVRLARSPQTNAFADGRYVIMTSSLLDFVTSDDELAVILAHELAHNLLGHKQQLREQGVPHGFLRGFGGNAARVRATEEEADRLSVALLAAAGYDLAAAVPLWRRYQARFGGLQLFRTHPSAAARERAWHEAVAALPLAAEN